MTIGGHPYHYGQNSCFLAKISRGSTTEDTEHTERRTVPKGQRFPRSACPWSNRVSHVSGRYVRFRPQFLCHRQSRAPKHSERTSVFSVNSVVIPSFHRVRLCRTGRFVVPPRSVAVLLLQVIRGWPSSPSVAAQPRLQHVSWGKDFRASGDGRNARDDWSTRDR